MAAPKQRSNGRGVAQLQFCSFAIPELLARYCKTAGRNRLPASLIHPWPHQQQLHRQCKSGGNVTTGYVVSATAPVNRQRFRYSYIRRLIHNFNIPWWNSTNNNATLCCSLPCLVITPLRPRTCYWYYFTLNQDREAPWYVANGCFEAPDSTGWRQNCRSAVPPLTWPFSSSRTVRSKSDSWGQQNCRL